MEINIDVEPALDSQRQSDQDEFIDDQYENIGEDFDNIDVDVDIDVNHKAKLNKEKQMALAAEIAAADNISEFDDDYLQDDIPIDDDDDEDEDEGISDNGIADNYPMSDPKSSDKGAESEIESSPSL